jgi:glycosyltransferase involved in cell wall biosynthesis
MEQRVTYDVGYMLNMLKTSDHIITVTQAERQFLIDAGFEHQRITTAGNGISLGQFPTQDKAACRRELGLDDDAFVLLFLGRKTEYKGLELVLKAFVALQQQCPDLHLLTVGPETDHSQTLWARHDGLSRLTNYGSVSDATRLAALNACDCLAMPSTGEAFGIVFLEAWSVGKPVIGARTHAVSSIIADGHDGFLIEPRSVEEMADRIVRLMEDPSLVQQMGERGRAKVLSRYTVPRITDIVEGVYLRLMRRREYQAAQDRN